MTWLLEGNKAGFSYFHVGPIFFPLSTSIKHYHYTEESLLLQCPLKQSRWIKYTAEQKRNKV